MHEQRSGDGSGVSVGQSAAGTVLDILMEQHPGLLAIEELVAIYGGLSMERSAAQMVVEDALAELLGSGLAHRLERFVFVSRAGMRAVALAR